MIKLIVLISLLWKVDCYLYNLNDQSKTKDCNSTNQIHYYWKIKNHPKDAFLFGTIHIPFIKIFQKLPTFLDKQISKSDIVYFELDLLNNEIRRELLNCQLLPEGKNLKNYLIDKQIYRKLKMFFRNKRNDVDDKLYYDMFIRNWRFKKLIWILFLLNFLIENDSQYLRVPSLDNLIALKVKQRNKIKSLESVEDQCSALDSLDQNQVISYINITLNNYFNELTEKQQVHHRNDIDILIQNYKCGTLNESIFNLYHFNSLIENSKFNFHEMSHRVNKISINRNYNSIKQRRIQLINRKFHKQLIDKRNKKLGEMISAELNKNQEKNLLFVIGTAHFISEGMNSILKNLEDKGHQVEKVIKNINSNSNLLELRESNFHTDLSLPIYQRKRSESNSSSRLIIEKNILNKKIHDYLTNSRINSLRKSYNNFWIYFKLGFN